MMIWESLIIVSVILVFFFTRNENKKRVERERIEEKKSIKRTERERITREKRRRKIGERKRTGKRKEE